ncbi:MAG: sensor domain-containing diguanylate cyclase [Acetobacteraceae bacterium]|nr:sensor domain-containing diguanylate cyclase [Acetobacteraceae bacterium]
MRHTAAMVRFREGVLVLGYGLLIALSFTRLFTVVDWSSLGYFFFVAVVAEWLLIPLPTGTLSVTFSVILPVFMIHGTLPTAWLATLASLLGNGVLRRRSLSIALFNGAQCALSALAGGAAYHLFSPLPEYPLAGAGLNSNPMGMVAFVLVYIVVNHVLVQLFWVLRQGKQPVMRHLWPILLESVRWDVATCFLTIPLGLIMTWLYAARGPLGASLVIVPVLAVAYIFRLHLSLSLANRELTTLYEVAQKVSSVLQLEKLFDLIADAVRRVMNYDSCTLYLWDEIRQELSAVVVRPASAAPHEGDSVRLGEGIVGSVASSRRPELIVDASRDPRTAGRPRDPQACRSLMVVPLIVEDQLVGALSLGDLHPSAFSREHLRLLTILASQAAVAIENAILYKRTEHLAITDPMTELYNYRYFYVKLGDELKRARMQNSAVSLIYLDLDNFKQYNDTFGHPTGDRVLREFADIIRKSIRDTDTPVRYAGDEFVVLLANTDLEEARQVAERIRRSVEAHVFLESESPSPIRLTVSAGVASYPRNARTEAELIYLADQAMYQGKRNGLNRVSAYGVRQEPGACP